MSIKDINCPHCKKDIPISEYRHDKKLNLICCFCDQIVFGTTLEGEGLVRKIVHGDKKEPLAIRLSNCPEETETVPTATVRDMNEWNCFC